MTMTQAPSEEFLVLEQRLNGVAFGLLVAISETAAALCGDASHRERVARHLARRVAVYPADFPHRDTVETFLRAVATHLQTAPETPPRPRLELVK